MKVWLFPFLFVLFQNFKVVERKEVVLPELKESK